MNHIAVGLRNRSVLKDWRIFVHQIHTHSGKHNHQGALGLFVLDGDGYTIVDGKRVEWKKGDLILLPIKPGGVDHQHFNRNPDKPARWLALSYRPFKEAMAQFIEQKRMPQGINRPSRCKGQLDDWSW